MNTPMDDAGWYFTRTREGVVKHAYIIKLERLAGQGREAHTIGRIVDTLAVAPAGTAKLIGPEGDLKISVPDRLLPAVRAWNNAVRAYRWLERPDVTPQMVEQHRHELKSAVVAAITTIWPGASNIGGYGDAHLEGKTFARFLRKRLPAITYGQESTWIVLRLADGTEYPLGECPGVEILVSGVLIGDELKVEVPSELRASVQEWNRLVKMNRWLHSDISPCERQKHLCEIRDAQREVLPRLVGEAIV